MDSYIILCPADTKWSMSPEEFSIKLKERWPETEIGPALISNTAFWWNIKDETIDLQGYFDEDGLTVGFDRIEGHAIFACWYRSLVPPDVPLIMMDQPYNEVYPLTHETTPDDILSDRIVLRPPPDPRVLFTRGHKPQGTG